MQVLMLGAGCLALALAGAGASAPTPSRCGRERPGWLRHMRTLAQQ